VGSVRFGQGFSFSDGTANWPRHARKGFNLIKPFLLFSYAFSFAPFDAIENVGGKAGEKVLGTARSGHKLTSKVLKIFFN